MIYILIIDYTGILIYCLHDYVRILKYQKGCVDFTIFLWLHRNNPKRGELFYVCYCQNIVA